MPDRSRAVIVDLLRRFLRGDVTREALRRAACDLVFQPLCGETGRETGGAPPEPLFCRACAGDLCDLCRLEASDFSRMGFRLETLIEPVSRFLQRSSIPREADSRSCVAREEFFGWLQEILTILRCQSYQESCAGSPHLLMTFELIALITTQAPFANTVRSSRCLDQILMSLQQDQPVSSRRVFGQLLYGLKRIDLQTVDVPLDIDPFGSREWYDVSLVTPTVPPKRCWKQAPPPRASKEQALLPAGFESTRWILFSVFTREFFYETLPGLVRSGGDDLYYYHPENDKAVALIEDFPGLRGSGKEFHYYVDRHGLAEVVLHKDELERSDVVFATQLFCLLNRIRHAQLDGEEIDELDSLPSHC